MKPWPPKRKNVLAFDSFFFISFQLFSFCPNPFFFPWRALSVAWNTFRTVNDVRKLWNEHIQTEPDHSPLRTLHIGHDGGPRANKTSRRRETEKERERDRKKRSRTETGRSLDERNLVQGLTPFRSPPRPSHFGTWDRKKRVFIFIFSLPISPVDHFRFLIRVFAFEPKLIVFDLHGMLRLHLVSIMLWRGLF